LEGSAPYLIDGTGYNRAQLTDLCRRTAADSNVPEWKREIFRFIRLFLEDTAGTIRQRTSGTTGEPGWHELEKRAMITSAERTIRFFDLHPGDRVLLCLPVEYIAGKMMVVRALTGGLDMVLTEPSGRPLEGIKGTFSFTAMVPLQLFESLRYRDDLAALDKLLVGGGELHPSMRAELSGIMKPVVYESFAMTETCSHFALKRISGPSPDPLFLTMEGSGISLDERGCLVVEVNGITKGPVATNDLAEIPEPGNGFRWLGRIDNMINTGGIKVFPEVLEERIGKLLRAPCLVIPRPDRKLGQRLVLLVEWPHAGAPVDRWRELLGKELAVHEAPKEYFPVRKIPRNESFKADRKAAARLI
jgi:O-succinylbenzoic acid--CoA ligase